jgi:hypothetical protein
MLFGEDWETFFKEGPVEGGVVGDNEDDVIEQVVDSIVLDRRWLSGPREEAAD